MKRTGLSRRTRLQARSTTKRPPPGRDDAYRAHIRSLPCLLMQLGHWHTCGTRPGRLHTEAAHVKPWGSSRVDRRNLWPACPKHHDEQEGRSKAFEARYSVDLKAAAARLGNEWAQR